MKTIDHESVQKDNIITNEIQALTQSESDSFRKTFSAFRDTNMQQIPNIISSQPQQKKNKKRASLICSLIRSELKKNNDRHHFLKRRGNIGTSKGFKY